MALGAAVFTIGVAMQAGAANLAMFALGRVVEGLGEGLYSSTQTVYICEISPPRVQGVLTGFWFYLHIFLLEKISNAGEKANSIKRG